MIEYLYDCIKATAGQDFVVAARVTDEEGQLVNELCGFMLHDKNNELLWKVDGLLEEDVWEFHIPAELTKELNGRYWYCICVKDKNISFQQPIYLM